MTKEKVAYPAALKLHETKARHDAAVYDFTISIEKLLDVYENTIA